MKERRTVIELKEEFDNILNLKLEEHRDYLRGLSKDEIYEASVETFLLQAIVRGLQATITTPNGDDILFLEDGWVEYMLDMELEEFPDLDPDYLSDVYDDCFDQYLSDL